MPRRVMEGRVVSDKTHKTVTVLVERRIMDPLYKKFIRQSKKYAAHDEGNAFRTGDFVAIEECPPISKSKRWRVVSAPPTAPREEKPVVKALAARAEAELNKPDTKKVARAKAAAAARPAGATPETEAAAPAKKAAAPKPEKPATGKPAATEAPKAKAATKKKDK